jgi:hypothetical protein
MLAEEFLSPMQIDEQQLAESIHVPHERIKEIISDRKSINARARYSPQIHALISTPLKPAKSFAALPPDVR